MSLPISMPLAALVICAAPAVQSGEPAPAFEVVSVKPFTGQVGLGTVRLRGGPGTNSPGRIDYVAVPAMTLVKKAFDLRDYQISAPGWLESARFDVSATIPPLTSASQFRLMLQHLLATRFNLAAHHVQKEVQGYGLVVAKGGHKLAAPPVDLSAEGERSIPAGRGFRFDRNSYPAIAELKAAGFSSTLNVNGRVRHLGIKESMREFAGALVDVLRQPVFDLTGLSGEYDFTVYWMDERIIRSDSDGPSLFEALQQQLGLKMVAQKGLIDTLVIDHMDKVPVAN